MKRGMLYGAGAGLGDPEPFTLKTVRILQIATPFVNSLKLARV